jgi:hypothetical protein
MNCQGQATKIGDAYRKLTSDYFMLVLAGSKEAVRSAGALIEWHKNAQKVHFDGLSAATLHALYVVAGPDASDGGYKSSNFTYNPRQSTAENLRADFINKGRKDVNPEAEQIFCLICRRLRVARPSAVALGEHVERYSDRGTYVGRANRGRQAAADP